MNTVAGRLPTGEAVRVSIDGERIAAVEPEPAAPDQVIAPGLVDLQVNGYGGLDVNEVPLQEETVHALAGALWRHGVTAFCPTLISASEQAIVAGLRTIAQARDADTRTARSIVGVHVEGPYLSAAEGARGAHPVEQLRDPSIEELHRWQSAAPGLLRIVTLAPERAGAGEYIAELVRHGIIAAIGHSQANARQVRDAIARGAALATHLGNGIPHLLPRHDNVVWPLLAAGEVSASFIADGQHLPPETFVAMARAKGIARSLLVSDSAALAGMPPGQYRTPVGGAVTVQAGGRLTLTGTPYLAGAGAALDECVAWVASCTPFSLDEALTMACANPAALLGHTASLRPGDPADLVVLKQVEGRWTVCQTVLGGETVYPDGNESSRASRTTGAHR